MLTFEFKRRDREIMLKLKDRKLFLRIFLSYILVLSIPIVLMGYVTYGKLFSILKTQKIEANKRVMHQTKDNLDLQIIHLNRMTFQLSQNKDIYKLACNKDIDQINKNYMIKNIMKELRMFNINDNFKNNIWIYFKDQNLVLSSIKCYESDKFYTDIINYKDISYEKWLEKLNDITTVSICSNMTVASTHKDNDRRIITYVDKLLFHDVFLIILIDEVKFLDLFAKDNIFGEGTFGIINNDNQIVILSSTMEADLTYNYIEQLVKNAGSSQFYANGQNYIIIYDSSQITDWRLFYIAREESLVNEIKWVKTIFNATVVICIFFGGALAYILSNKHYKPVKEILKFINLQNNMMHIKPHKSEHDIIMDAIRDIYYKEKVLQEQLDRQIYVLRSHVLECLIKNSHHMEESEIKEAIDIYELDFKFDSFLVAIVNVDELRDFGDIRSKTVKELAFFVISNIGEEILSQRCFSYSVELDSKVVFIINYDKSTENHKHPLLDLFIHIKDYVSTKIGIFISILVGRGYSSIDMISKSYCDAMVVYNYSITNNLGKIIYYDDISLYSKTIYYPPEKEMQLINCVKAGDKIATAKILNEIFKKNFNIRRLNTQMERLVLNNLISTIFKIIDDIQLDYDEELGKKLENLLTIDCTAYSKEMFESIKEILINICNDVEKLKDSTNIQLKNDIVIYIQDNYTDKSLSLVQVADKFNISVPYLSKFFKEQTGINFNEYLNRIRLNEGKRLLKTTDMPIKEIAQTIGYNSANTFIRVFKKYENITPGQYRESYEILLQIEQF